NRFTFRHRLTAERFALVRASVRAGRDTRLDNNAARALVACAGKPRVLIVDSNPAAAEHLAGALRDEGLEVDPPRPPAGLPATLSELQTDAGLTRATLPLLEPPIPLRKLQLLKLYVQELGGGLLVLGGDRSFGLGGYTRSALDDLLPVASDFEARKEKPVLA